MPGLSAITRGPPCIAGSGCVQQVLKADPKYLCRIHSFSLLVSDGLHGSFVGSGGGLALIGHPQDAKGCPCVMFGCLQMSKSSELSFISDCGSDILLILGSGLGKSLCKIPSCVHALRLRYVP